MLDIGCAWHICGVTDLCGNDDDDEVNICCFIVKSSCHCDRSYGSSLNLTVGELWR